MYAATSKIVALYVMTNDIRGKIAIKNLPIQPGINKNDHRSGGAVKEVFPYICIKHIIKL